MEHPETSKPKYLSKTTPTLIATRFALADRYLCQSIIWCWWIFKRNFFLNLVSYSCQKLMASITFLSKEQLQGLHELWGFIGMRSCVVSIIMKIYNMVVKAQVQPLKLRSKTEPSSIPGRPGKKLQVKEWTAILKQSKSEKGLCKYIYMYD